MTGDDNKHTFFAIDNYAFFEAHTLSHSILDGIWLSDLTLHSRLICSLAMNYPQS